MNHLSNCFLNISVLKDRKFKVFSGEAGTLGTPEFLEVLSGNLGAPGLPATLLTLSQRRSKGRLATLLELQVSRPNSSWDRSLLLCAEAYRLGLGVFGDRGQWRICFLPPWT